MNTIEYKVLNIGKLKYDRFKSISILKQTLNSFDCNYSYTDAKRLFDDLINGKLNNTMISLTFKYCFDQILNNSEYQLNDVYEYEDFPYNIIRPIG
jgi:hypothetical protein